MLQVIGSIIFIGIFTFWWTMLWESSPRTPKPLSRKKEEETRLKQRANLEKLMEDAREEGRLENLKKSTD